MSRRAEKVKGCLKPLSGDRGTLYEIPLVLMAYGVLCAAAIPWLHRSFAIPPAVILIPFLLIGLAAACFLGRAISIPRVCPLGAPACFWVYLLLSGATLPLMTVFFAPWSNAAILLGQVYLSFRIDLMIAEKKNQNR